MRLAPRRRPQPDTDPILPPCEARKKRSQKQQPENEKRTDVRQQDELFTLLDARNVAVDYARFIPLEMHETIAADYT